MRTHHVIAHWDGFCADCHQDRPLVLVQLGPRGVRGWLSGAGPEDRSLRYACEICGRVEQVPATEAEDAAYDATLLRWPDWVPALQATQPTQPTVPLVHGDVFGAAAARLAAMAPAVTVPMQRRPVVHVLRLPVQRVSATDLALAVA